MEAIPDLTRSLRSLQALEGVAAAPWDGPRWWWRGSLDAEGLAVASVQAAATALTALTGSQHYSVSTERTAAAFNSLGHLRIAGKQPEGFAPLSGFRRTLDGWIRLHANYPHHAARLLAALEVPDPEGVDRALGAMPSLEAEERIIAANGVAAAVRQRRDWVGSAMYGSVSGAPWISFLTADPTPSPERTWAPAPDPVRPLRGLKVLDLTRVIAGPVATRLLGALGADVLRIDPPHLPELPDAFVDTGFGKRSAVADFSVANELSKVHGLVDEADVVVTGYREGALERYGLDPRQLVLRRGNLVVAALTAWGGGPWRERRGFDSLVQAACGIAWTYGSEDDGGWRPGALPVQALDHATGYGLAAAVLGLLAEMQQTGRGGIARLSLARTAEELYASGSLPQGGGSGPATPEYEYADSPHGRLRFVGPPLLVDGLAFNHTSAPVRYGSSELAWSPRPAAP